MVELVQLISPDEIAVVVGRLAARIREDYRGRTPVLVCVLKGAFMFTADLARKLDMPVEVEFIRAASYGDACVTSGHVKVTKGPECELGGRDVIVVEDILDTGLTLDAVVRHIEGQSPASVRVCTLLDKPARRVACREADYVGMSIDDHFVVGYGLDCAGRHRNLAGLYIMKPPSTG